MKTSALMRRKQAGLPLEDNEYVPLIKRGSRQWEGLPLSIQPEPTPPPKIETSQTPTQTRSRSRLAKGKKVESEVAPTPTTTAAVTTQKTALAHQATYDARNHAFQVNTDILNCHSLFSCYYSLHINPMVLQIEHLIIFRQSSNKY